MTSAEGMTAFVPNGDSRKDTATLLLGAARDNGLDDSRAVVAVQGGFYISDELADALGDEAPEVKDSTVSETQKAVNQLEAERHDEDSQPDAEAAVAAAINPEPKVVQPPEDGAPDPEAEADSKPEPKAKAKKTSGNRAAKASTTEKE